LKRLVLLLASSRTAAARCDAFVRVLAQQAPFIGADNSYRRFYIAKRNEVRVVDEPQQKIFG